MVIYGLGLLSFCYLLGQIVGEYLGKLIGVDANVGGVGFAMLLLIILVNWFKSKNWFDQNSELGISFWSNMYLPIIVAMSSIQNVSLAISKGILPIVAGVLAVVVCFVLIPYLSKIANK